jgi:hypothetical protein
MNLDKLGRLQQPQLLSSGKGYAKRYYTLTAISISLPEVRLISLQLLLKALSLAWPELFQIMRCGRARHIAWKYGDVEPAYPNNFRSTRWLRSWLHLGLLGQMLFLVWSSTVPQVGFELGHCISSALVQCCLVVQH